MPAHVHKNDAVAHALGKAHFVGDHHHGHAALGQAHHDIQDLAHHLGVERGRGFIEEHDDGVHAQRTRDGHALLLSTGQLAGVLVFVGQQAHAVEQLVGLGLRIRQVAAEDLHLGDGQVFRDRQMGEQLEVLEHHAHLAAQLGFVGHGVVHGRAIDPDDALLDGFQRVHGFDEGGLAGAGRPADHHHVAFVDDGGAIGQHLGGTVPFGNVLNLNHFVAF